MFRECEEGTAATPSGDAVALSLKPLRASFTALAGPLRSVTGGCWRFRDDAPWLPVHEVWLSQVRTCSTFDAACPENHSGSEQGDLGLGSFSFVVAPCRASIRRR